MTASALPAVLIKCAMSSGPAASTAAFVRPDRVEMVEIDESMEEFRGGFLTGSARSLAGPAMAEKVWCDEGGTLDCVAFRGFSPLVVSFVDDTDFEGSGLDESECQLGESCLV
jgi:hypothetical protein